MGKFKAMPKIEKLESYEISGDFPESKILHWVLLARCKDGSRRNINFLNVQDSFFAATDGYRIHCASLEKIILPNGHYSPIFCRKGHILLKKTEENISFPDYWNLFRENRPLDKTDIDFLKDSNRPTSTTENVWKIFHTTGAAFQIPFLEDLCYLSWNRPKFEVQRNDDGKVTMLIVANEDNARWAAVMSIRL